MNIRQLMKWKSISDGRSVENISDKNVRIEVQPALANGLERAKAFCERPFTLHRHQPEKDKQNFDVAPTGKTSADVHGWTISI